MTSYWEADAEAQASQKDDFFDPWLIATGAPLLSIVRQVIEVLDADAEERGLRQRKRRPQDQANYQAMAETLVANLAYSTLLGPCARPLAVSLETGGKLRRYNRRLFKKMPEVIEQLEAVGIIIFSKAEQRGLRSTIQPTPAFIEQIAVVGVSFADFARHDDEELVLLGKSSWGFHGSAQGARPGRRSVRIDYAKDTEESTTYRNELRTINAFLRSADLAYVGNDAKRIDIYKRTLRRHFNLDPGTPETSVRFDLGGRLFGGWWQTLPKAKRSHIRIDGHPIADLDYAGMFPRLAYRHIDKQPPQGDLYLIPGLEGHRDGIKQLTNALLFAPSTMKRLPRDIKPHLPQSTTAERARAAILAHRPELEEAFECGMGYKLMFDESQIMVALLLRLQAEGIVALPMHDGIIVAEVDAAKAVDLMGDVTLQTIGIRLPVTNKTEQSKASPAGT